MKKVPLIICLLLATALPLTGTVHRAHASPPEEFGNAVATSGDGSSILVGAVSAPVTTSVGMTIFPGEAFLFDSNGNLLQTYQDPSPTDGEDFGSSVALSDDGSSILIGAERAPVTTSAGTTADRGEAFLFDSSGNLLQTYQGPSQFGSEFFGSSVAISSDGSSILVGAQFVIVTTSSGATVSAGEAFLFDSNGNLLQTYQDPSPPTSRTEDFGRSVALSDDGSSILIGADFATATISSGGTVAAGQAFLFDSNGNLLQTYQDPNPTDREFFGSSVALSSDGSTILIGAEDFASCCPSIAVTVGAAFLFDSSGNLLQMYQEPTPHFDDLFGGSVAISGDGSTILIGARGGYAILSNGNSQSGLGDAYLFDSSGNLLQTYQDPNPCCSEAFGWSAAISGDGSTILTGAPFAQVTTSTGTTAQAGKAFFFDSGGNLLQTYQDPNL